MLSERTNGVARDLLVAAKAVEHTEHGGDLAALPGELEELGDALRAAGCAYESSASRVVPGARPLDLGICSRYQRAAARWPASPPPSHERFAAALASLDAAAEAARLAARRCDRARQAVDVLLRTSTPSRRDVPYRSNRRRLVTAAERGGPPAGEYPRAPAAPAP